MLTESTDDLAAAEVTEKLGYLPLAIVQAGAYVSTRRMPLKDYPDVYDIMLSKVLSEKPPSAVWNYGDRTILTTWEISFQAIKEEDEEAADLLLLCAFLSNDDIREDLLRRGKRLGENGMCMYKT